MTTTIFGGSPSIETRRQFSNISSSAQIPGYAAFIPQLRFRHGHTYANETEKISKEYPLMNGTLEKQRYPEPDQLIRSKTSILSNRRQQQLNNSFNKHENSPWTIDMKKHLNQSSKAQLENSLRRIENNRINPIKFERYSHSLLPGYTGFIPHKQKLFGATFSSEGDKALEQFSSECEQKEMKNSSFDQFKENNRKNIINNDDLVKTLKHASQPKAAPDRKQEDEAPIPGYAGFIPRMNVTQNSLGVRFKTASELCLDEFRPRNNKLVPLTGNNMRRSISKPKTAMERTNVIPLYTGHIPNVRYRIGETFGKTIGK
ncbi:hypothetical protein SNEBB_010952 [Seison nebaliae]|nr:hypothetical protein SNEBB_010952 [Seison nebaliae]